MSELVLTHVQTGEQEKLEPPQRWVNRYFVHASRILVCYRCGKMIPVTAFTQISTHCYFFPSKEEAEKANADNQKLPPDENPFDVMTYQGAFRCD